jgi:hypothetical protein
VYFVFFISKAPFSLRAFQIMNGSVFRDQVRPGQFSRTGGGAPGPSAAPKVPIATAVTKNNK